MAKEVQDSELRILFYSKFKNLEILVFFSTIGAILTKVYAGQYPYVNTIFVSTLATMSALSYLFAFSSNLIYDIKHGILVIIMGMSSSILCVGILFKFMYWPGGKVILLFGLAIAFISLVWIVITLPQKVFVFENKYNKLLIYKLFFMVSISIWLTSISSVELFREIDVLGKDPKAVMLFEAHKKDPTSYEKRVEYEDYRRNSIPQENH